MCKLDNVQADLLTVHTGDYICVQNKLCCLFSTFVLINMPYHAFLLDCANYWKS